MMKMVPARRRVTDASLVPPASLAFSRANGLLGTAVVGCASITATAESQSDAARVCGEAPVYQRFVKIWLDGASRSLSSWRRPGRQRESIQIDIELITSVAADQGQFQCGAIRVHARRRAVELERETLHSGRGMLDQLRHRQAPIRGRSLDKKINGTVVRRDHVDQHLGFTLALDVADGERIGVADI